MTTPATHTFEHTHREDTEFALSGRVAFHEIEKDRALFQSNPTACTLLAVLPIPAIVTNEQRQIVCVNPLALEMVGAAADSEVLGLRLGEFFGIDHAFRDRECGQHGGCADCNSMQAIVSALNGQPAEELGQLAMFPRDPSRARTYALSARPLELDNRRLAVLFATPTA